MDGTDHSARWTEQLLVGSEEIAEVVRPYVVGFASLRGELFGSGILARRGAMHFVLTAGHVVGEMRSALERDEVALVTNATSGVLRIPPGTAMAGRYVEGPPRFDAGAVRLEAQTVSAINAWTVHQWFSLDLLIGARPINENGRIFFATGYPAAFVERSETVLAAQYTFVAWHAHPSAVVDGAFTFEMAADPIPLHGAASVERFSLSGLSGAPLWTFDVSEVERSIRLVGTHSASSADTAVAVHLRQHREFLAEKGWW